MATLLEILAALIGVGGIVAGVVYYMKKAANDSANLSQANAVLSQESARVDAMEKAAASARTKRVNEVNAKAAAVRTAGDAAGLLQAVTNDA